MNILLEVIFHQTGHVKEAKVLKFCQIDVLDMVIEKGLQNLHSVDRNIASQNHLSQVSQYFSL